CIAYSPDIRPKGSRAAGIRGGARFAPPSGWLTLSEAQQGKALLEFPANGSIHLRAQPDQQDDKQHNDRKHNDGMESGESREPDGKDVFNQAQENVGKRLRAGIRGRSHRRLGAVRAEGESAAGEYSNHTNCRTEMSECRSGEYGACGNANEGVDGIPNGIHERNLVGKESHQLQEPSRTNHPRAAENMQIPRQFDQMETLQQAKGEYSGVEVEPGEPRRSHSEAKCCQRTQSAPRPPATGTKSSHVLIVMP